MRSRACPAQGGAPTAGTHYVTVNEAVAPYKVAAHRHTPGDRAGALRARPVRVSVVFAPHLVPMSRGLLSTVYLDVTPGFSADDAVELYRGRYAEEPFVFVRDLGTMPSTAEVRGTNRAALGVAVDERSGTLGRGVRDRQPGQGRGGTGDPVPQRGSGVSGDRGSRPTRTGRLRVRR